jgi:hypothetical protein
MVNRRSNQATKVTGKKSSPDNPASSTHAQSSTMALPEGGQPSAAVKYPTRSSRNSSKRDASATTPLSSRNEGGGKKRTAVTISPFPSTTKKVKQEMTQQDKQKPVNKENSRRTPAKGKEHYREYSESDNESSDDESFETTPSNVHQKKKDVPMKAEPSPQEPWDDQANNADWRVSGALDY